MHLIKPSRPGVIDALTGNPLPAEGVVRAVLLPADHYSLRTGDITAAPATVTPRATRPARAARAAAKPAQPELIEPTPTA